LGSFLDPLLLAYYDRGKFLGVSMKLRFCILTVAVISREVVFRCSAVLALLFFLMLCDSRAQSVDVFVGVRGGFTSSSSPLEVGQNHYLPDRYSSRYSPTTLGTSVGIVLNNRFEIRVEAAKYRFHYASQTGAPYPASGSKTSAVTDGHAWQFPILATYPVWIGSLRTLVGGGLSVRSVKSTVTATTTTIDLPSPTETTTTRTYAYARDDNPVALHASIGLELRRRWISFRPEMRLGFWTGYQGQSESKIIGSPIQAEFIMGVRMHPFRVFGY